MTRNALALSILNWSFYVELRRHIGRDMIHNFYSLQWMTCLYSWTCPRLLDLADFLFFGSMGAVFFFCDDSDKGQWIQGLSNQRNDWILAKSTLMYCDLSDLGSLILVQIIPKKWADVDVHCRLKNVRLVAKLHARRTLELSQALHTFVG